MARKKTSELEFGSDSFLDIIANIVGILIILIVVAGLRAGQSPPEAADEKPVAAVTPVVKPPKVKPAPPKPPAMVQRETPRPKLPPVPVPIPRALPEPDSRLPRQIAASQRQLTELRNQRERLQLELLAVRRETSSLKAKQAQSTQAFRDKLSEGNSLRKRMAALDQSVKTNEATLAALLQQYDEAKRQSKNVKQVRHQLTAVGRQVTGNEIHFRVAGGRVARIPLKRLVDQMKEDVLRRKDWLLKFPVHRGTVGPIGGFSMTYVVQRQAASAVDQLTSGYTSVQIVLGGWKINPTPNLEAESTVQAMNLGSAFYSALRDAAQGSTLTFWVYPDSFETFRTLQEAARREGFRVAARPLPFGVPIAGSPRGTRSVGQ